MKESSIQTKIKMELEKAGWFVTKLIQTSTNGIMDLLALKSGRAVFIECKRLGEQPTELQKFRAKQIRELGFEVISPACCVDDVKHLLTG